MRAVLATYNIKGGVGKTSTAVNLAYLAAREGRRTLVWDLDPQAATTYLFRVKPKVRGGARKLVRLKGDVGALLKATDHRDLDLLPADFSYRHMDLALDDVGHPARRLARVLEPLRAEYDIVILDCPPSISLVSESVFGAADALLVPVIPAALSARTLEQLEPLLEGDSCPLLLPFFSMVDVGREQHRRAMARLRAAHPAMLGVVVPLAEEVEWMGEERDVVGAFAPSSGAALAYEALWWDVKRRLARRGLNAKTLPRP